MSLNHGLLNPNQYRSSYNDHYGFYQNQDQITERNEESECQSNYDDDVSDQRNSVMRGTMQSCANLNYDNTIRNQRRTLSNFNELRSHNISSQHSRLSAHENLRE